MEQTEGYAAPVVADAGDVVAVTLGSNNFDTADDTQYVKTEDD
ncbi:lasso RiPP family leader peptide-containing protein [Streptomyces alkaliphilus]|nr:lasso RiPP family leader peptide-containing protein [Streptomyces alkaliphilus]MQS06073.1 lasso RiPP family leader peptide-containing protein [Streptomyces alkaliphilus]